MHPPNLSFRALGGLEDISKDSNKNEACYIDKQIYRMKKGK